MHMQHDIPEASGEGKIAERRVVLTHTRPVAAIAIMLAGLIGMAACRESMVQTGRNHQLVPRDIRAVAPPHVAVGTIALGGFRGIITDILFLRLVGMQDDGNYMEMVQLASWIVKLQPEFTGATSFLAWNMAYNVSVLYQSPEDRWRWVRNGIRLLRDDALTYSPDNVDLYRELGWIFLDKIGDTRDAMNRYYKFSMARDIGRILGDAGDSMWQNLAAGPGTVNDLNARLAITGTSLDAILDTTGYSLAELDRDFRSRSLLPERITKKLGDSDIARAMDTFLRVRWLWAETRLDPVLVLEAMDAYGYLDFRLPDAHAVYWARRGLTVAPHRRDLGCERMIFQALKAAFSAGRMIATDDWKHFQTTPNIALADAVASAYRSALSGREENVTILSGYENFLIDSVVVLYTFGKRDQAQMYLGTLRTDAHFGANPKYRADLDTFVIRQIAGDLNAMSGAEANVLVQGLLLRAYEALVFRDNERADGFARLAAVVYRRYTQSIHDEDEAVRAGLGSFTAMRDEVRNRMLQSLPDAAAARLREAIGHMDIVFNVIE